MVEENEIEEDLNNAIIKAASSCYNIIGDPDKLKTLLLLRENVNDGLNKAEIEFELNLENDSIIAQLVYMNLVEIGDNSKLFLTRAGAGLLTHVDSLRESILSSVEKHLNEASTIREILERLYRK